MYALPTFYVGHDRERVEKQLSEIKEGLSRARKEIKHYYYGLPVVEAGWVEDHDITTSRIFERAYSGGLSHVRNCLAMLNGGVRSEEEIAAEGRKERTYESILRFTYDETEKNGAEYRYFVEMEFGSVNIHRIVHKKTPPEGTKGYLRHDDRMNATHVTPPYREKIFFMLLDDMDADLPFRDEQEVKMYRGELERMMMEAVPCSIFSPQRNELTDEERNGASKRDFKEVFIDELKKIGIDEWEHRYEGEADTWTTTDGSLCENHCPTWSLKIEYSDGKEPLTFSGENDCPYNLYMLVRLLDGIEDRDFSLDDHDFFWLDYGRDEDLPKDGGRKDERENRDGEAGEEENSRDDESSGGEDAETVGIVFSGLKRYYREDLTKDDFTLENTTPYRIVVEGHVIEEHAWGAMLVRVVSLLLELHPEHGSELLGFSPYWTKQSLFADTEKTNHKKVKEGLYLNVNHLSTRLCLVLRDILDIFKVDKSGVEFFIHRPCGAESKVVREYIERRIKKSFREYLTGTTGKSESYADKVVSNIEKSLNPKLATMSKSYDNFFLIDDVTIFDGYSSKIRNQIKKTYPMNSPSIDTLNVCLDLLKSFFVAEKKKYKDENKNGN